MSANIKNLENRLWEAADYLRANSALRLNEFAEPVLGLIFLKFAGVKHSKIAKELAKERDKKIEIVAVLLFCVRDRYLLQTILRVGQFLFLKKLSFHIL